MDEKSNNSEEGRRDIEDGAVVEPPAPIPNELTVVVPVENEPTVVVPIENEPTVVVPVVKEPTIAVKTSKAPPLRSLQRGAPSRDLPGLVLHVFKIHEHGKVVKCDDVFDGLKEALAANASTSFYDEYQNEVVHRPVYWVDVDADERDRAELYEWIDKLHLGYLIADQIKKPLEEWVSNVVSTRLKTLMVIRILPEIDEKAHNIPNRVEYLAAVTTRHMLLTYTTAQKGGDGSIDKLSIHHMTQDECLLDGSSSAALIAWLEFHIVRTRSIVNRIRQWSVDLVSRMDKDPANVQLEDIMQFRDSLLIVLAVAEEQSLCLDMIMKLDEDTDGLDFNTLKGILSIMIATAESTERMALRLEKRGTDLKQSYDSHQQDRMNRRLAVLTIVSVIFMPLTFLAGIYGMNFSNMPELETDNGYFVLIGAMVAIAITMLGFFQYHGWFE